MARISMRITLGDFALHKQNDTGGKDEPFLLTLFAKLDAPLGDFGIPLDQKAVPIHFPDALGHGDLGPNSDGMSLSGRNRVPVPASIGEWNGALDTTHLHFALSVMRSCSVGTAVVFLEEDSTLDSSIEAMLPVLKGEVRKRANKLLRFVLGLDPELPASLPGRAQIIAALAAYRQQLRDGGLDVNGAINGGGLMDHVLAAVLPGEIGKAIGKVLIPGGGELWNLIAAGIQAADPDEFIGADGRQHSFFDFVGLAHAPMAFKMESAHAVALDLPFPPGFQPPQIIDTSNGHYSVEAEARRTDTDEPPVLAAVRGPADAITVFARRVDGDIIGRMRSTDFGKTFEAKTGGSFDKGVFQAGPSAANSADGKTWCVAGLGLDDEVWFNVTVDAGSAWAGWQRVGKRKKFRGAPAVAVDTAGTDIYVVARAASKHCWFTRSTDRGQTWADWRRIGAGVFHSSPAIVCLSPAPTRPPLPDVLVVAGLGTDKRVWVSRFAATEALADQGWAPIAAGPKDHATGHFTSAPSMVADGKEEIVLACRAGDLRYWRVNSFDGGRTFTVGTTWQPHGKPGSGRVRYNAEGKRSGDLQRMYSAPALVASSDMETRVLFGLTPTLALWRNRHTRQAVATWRPSTVEPETDLRVFYY